MKQMARITILLAVHNLKMISSMDVLWSMESTKEITMEQASELFEPLSLRDKYAC